MYYEDVLIKLRRQYSKDETVAALNKKISEMEFEKGQMIAEIDYLQSEIIQLQEDNNQLKLTKQHAIQCEAGQVIKNDPRYIQQKELLKNANSKIQTLKKDNSRLISEIVKLRNEINQ